MADEDEPDSVAKKSGGTVPKAGVRKHEPSDSEGTPATKRPVRRSRRAKVAADERNPSNGEAARAASVAPRRQRTENLGTGPDRAAKQTIYYRAALDFWEAVDTWRIWGMLAQQEIRMRYRRSTIGPFWMTLSMAIQMITMGTLVSILFNHSFGKFLPYVCINFIIWGLLTGVIMESAQTFITNQGYIQQIKRPYFFYLFQTIYRNILNFLHNIVVYIVIAFLFVVLPTAQIILLPFALILLLLNAGWMGMLCALACTRFRDVPMILQALFGVLFWLTPIIYYPSQLSGDKFLLVLFNPFFHILDIVRQPILGDPTYWKSWAAVTLLAIVGWGVTYLIFARVRARVVYWL